MDRTSARGARHLIAGLALAWLAAVLALAAAPAAHAAECPDGFACSTIAVPLDHADPSQGTLDLPLARHRASAGEGKPLLLAFTGGPGGATLRLADVYAERFAPALERYQLVLFDARGTGGTALRCPALQALGEYPAVTAATRETGRCAARLGSRADDFTTAATVEDIETVRTALGAEQVALYGVSYGTNVGQRYLLAHPDRLAALILDSVVDPGGLSAFWTPTFRAIPRVMRAQQPGTVGATRKLVRRLARGPIAGTAYGPDGRPRTVRLDSSLDLYFVFSAGDNRAEYRRQYPAAVRAALDGDPSALLRMHLALMAGHTDPPEAVSLGLFAATTCTDTNLPYPLSTPIADRAAAVRRALDGLSRRDLGGFDREAVLGASFAEICREWPVSALVPQSVPDVYPSGVPTLLLNGTADTRTPDESARAVQRRIPGSTLITIKGTGHAVLGTDASGCADDAANRLLLGQGDLPTCADVDNGLGDALPRMPEGLGDFEPQPADGGRAGRALAAVRASVNDFLGFSPVVGDGETKGLGGLHGGFATITGGADGSVFRYHRYEYVPGLRVSGRIADRMGTIRVRGLVHGRLAFKPKAIVATIDGVTVRQPR